MMLTGDGFFQHGLKLGLEKIPEMGGPNQETVNGRKRCPKERRGKGNANGRQGRWILTPALTSIR